MAAFATCATTRVKMTCIHRTYVHTHTRAHAHTHTWVHLDHERAVGNMFVAESRADTILAMSNGVHSHILNIWLV